jgi:hypothetical protein
VIPLGISGKFPGNGLGFADAEVPGKFPLSISRAEVESLANHQGYVVASKLESSYPREQQAIAGASAFTFSAFISQER